MKQIINGKTYNTQTVKTSMIHDARDHVFDNLDKCLAHAKNAGKPFLLFDGVVYRVQDKEPVFFPEFGYWLPDSLPFVGWADGYTYDGSSRWLQGLDVGCEMLSACR